ncbi:hypothetical protein SPBR_00549 [Sporothrix brasiliensis 5110]|uniref:Suppressor of anucleate metulae protein B n=1 Tax=Sporothrix brasiliensis 5110 TaxID=1398154 RepID=A0A0C2FHC2_9PEZI|nr:uncharacterized protein SPBR_00549 [Sporothrix brasiliensis 5110]KIH90483.1 hypothetical protein SPBR_00549 [Sporothrix brasiliensis 5110]
MTDSFESNLLRLLQAMQEQKDTFTAEAKRIADHCHSEHAGDGTAATNGTNNKATQGGDVEMTDAPSKEATIATPATTNSAKAFFCRPCYNDFLTMIYQTYASPAQPQWYATQQTSFVAEVGRLLDDVRNLRAPLSSVDNWINARKQAWLRSQLRDAVAVQTLAESLDAEKAAFHAQLADPTIQLDVLLHAVMTTAGNQVNGERERIVADVQTATKKLQQASTDSNEKSTIYRDNLFPGGVPDLPAVRAIEKKLLDGTVGLDGGLGDVLREVYGGEDEDARAAKIQKHQKRLAELKRAKAAHEAQKLKKMKPVDVPYFLQDDTPCATCGKAADPQKSPFCEVCFLEVDYCLRENQTVWCSTTCMKDDYAAHLAANHACAAGDRCTRAKPPGDSSATRQEPRYYFCRECVLSFSIGTVYCSERCAGRDFQPHREKVHLPNREMRADSRDDRGELSYSSARKVAYTAADIGKHVLSLDEALASCQKKHPDWDLATTKVNLTLPWTA